MTCNPNDNSLNPPNFGPPPDFGFGPIFSPPQIPFPDISLPPGIPEDIIALLEEIFAKIPGGKLIPSADGSFDSVFDAIASIMTMLSPFLAFYNFIMALLNMVICIIEVLCALLNPFKVIGALRRLFKVCIPDFLSMFPFIALILIILSFILLLIALIEYLINTIIAMINDLIANIVALGEAVQLGNEDAILAITQKIAGLLCLIEQLFALLIIFQSLFVIIQALAEIGGGKPCRRRKGDSDGCCDDEVCPPFIGDNPDGTFGTVGRLVYHNQINLDLSSLSIPGLEDQIAPLRPERWQFVDDQGNPEYPFNDIITPINDNIFWPQPLTFDKDDNLKNVVPYTVDIRLPLDPTTFGHSTINGSFIGYRFFRINNVIVRRQPYNGVLNYDNDLDITPPFGNDDGTLQFIGGLVFEDDGTTPFYVDGEQASIDTFIHKDSTSSLNLPNSEDGYQVSNIEWNLKINHAALMKYQIITAGCIPEIQTEANVIDATIPDISPAIDKIGGQLPDVDGALDCLNTAMAKFRQDVSIENASVFQNTVVGCLEDLRSQSEDIYEIAFVAGVSVYDSDVTVDPEVQFIDSSIQVSVNLKDSGGNELANGMPESAQGPIAALLEGEVTLGQISDFTYDGYNLFIADITSNTIGTGTVKVKFDGNYLSEVINRDDPDVETEIRVIELPYEFVGGIIGDGARPDSLNRRDETDVANE